jgi:ATP-dependent DNA helicase RecG
MPYLFAADLSQTNMAYPLYHPQNPEDFPLLLTIEEFRNAFPAESDFIEFKEGIGGSTLAETVAAFSNASGGVLVLGVKNDGTVVGLTIGSETTRRVHEIIRGVQNPGRYDVRELPVGNRTVVVVAVARREEGFAQLADGRVLMRKGASNVALLQNELTTFLANRALRRFEMTTTTELVVDASADKVAGLCSAYGWRSSSADRLEEQGFAKDGYLTIAGALLLLEDPAHHLGKTYVEFFRFPQPGAEYDRRFEIRGSADKQIERATEAVIAEVGHDLVVLGMRRHELPRLPVTVVREAIANAVAHRQYETNGMAIRIEVRPESVTIISPGPLPEPVTVRNLREQNAARNQHLIGALRRFGLAEDAGRGVDVMEDSMAQHLLHPPEFEDDGATVRVTLRLGSTVTPAERAWVQELELRGDIQPSDRVLLVHAARGEVLTNNYVRELVGVDSVEARAALQRLRDSAMLDQTGNRGGTQYTLASDLNAPAGLRLDQSELEDLILAMASNGPIRNEQVREVTGLDRARALSLLSSLVDQGRLSREGEKRGARYVLAERAQLQLPADD